VFLEWWIAFRLNMLQYKRQVVDNVSTRSTRCNTTGKWFLVFRLAQQCRESFDSRNTPQHTGTVSSRTYHSLSLGTCSC